MITFFGMPTRSSGIIRGLQIATHVGGNFYDKNSLVLISGDNKIYPKCVFIRDINKSHARNLKNKGHKIIYDLLDRPVADLHREQGINPKLKDISWKDYVDPCIDVFLVNNRKCYEMLEDHINPEQKIVIMPHHLITGNKVEKIPNRPIKNIGYLGTMDQLHSKEEISKFCESKGLKLLAKNIKSHKECIDFLKNIDIGLIYVDHNDRTDYVLKYKPNTKLTNFQAFGIPTICCKYISFEEHADKRSYIKVDNTEDLLSAINDLISNESLRSQISENSLKNAENFKINRIIEKYKNL